MKVLLTGASGFVGSHILDSLLARGISTAVLLRSSSSREFISPQAELRLGSISDPGSLDAAFVDVSHVIHCAGCTRSVKPAGFYETNHIGTRNVVQAVNTRSGQIKRLVHVSSLAVTGPATGEKPAREEDAPQPLSEYGRSKLRGEMEVLEGCRTDFTVIRPPAVYGPRDQGFLSMFKAVASHLLPSPNARQTLSLVYVKDLAEAIVAAMEHPAASKRIFFAASKDVVTAREMAACIAAEMGVWTVPCPLPAALLWPVCLSQELFARVTGKACLLNLQKFAELRAPGWVCDTSRMEKELGIACPTTLKEGVKQTLAWYREHKWV